MKKSKSKPCKECFGTGYLDEDEEDECFFCNSTGDAINEVKESFIKKELEEEFVEEEIIEKEEIIELDEEEKEFINLQIQMIL